MKIEQIIIHVFLFVKCIVQGLLWAHGAFHWENAAVLNDKYINMNDFQKCILHSIIVWTFCQWFSSISVLSWWIVYRLKLIPSSVVTVFNEINDWHTKLTTKGYFKWIKRCAELWFMLIGIKVHVNASS